MSKRATPSSTEIMLAVARASTLPSASSILRSLSDQRPPAPHHSGDTLVVATIRAQIATSQQKRPLLA